MELPVAPLLVSVRNRMHMTRRRAGGMMDHCSAACEGMPGIDVHDPCSGRYTASHRRNIELDSVSLVLIEALAFFSGIAVIYPLSLRKWRNWQTHHLEGVAPKRHAGSSPAFRTYGASVIVTGAFLLPIPAISVAPKRHEGSSLRLRRRPRSRVPTPKSVSAVVSLTSVGTGFKSRLPH
jgi:hypothetical protein